ncbi:hypothetical protein EU527_18730 [Candidatus Thorarchaeota archaeon]|nr:MAG: hypothetical protein EU527_18730 [Candidatus Thorarchaeota archaeon]
MPEPLIECPSCGHEVPEGKFCKLCGTPLPPKEPEESPIETNLSDEHSVGFEKEVDEPILQSLPHFEVSIDDMDYDSSAILLSKAELEVIDDELDRIIEQTKATRQALQLSQANKDVLKLRAETLRDDFERLKQRRRDLTSVTQKLILEQILDALDKHESRLTKLEEISNTLDKEVYTEQREEILGTIKELRSNLKDAIKTSKKWSKGIKKTLKTLQKETSRLDAKFKIGDISRSKYDESKDKIERSIRVIEGGQKKLDELLGIATTR